jgi:hypothetical protein
MAKLIFEGLTLNQAKALAEWFEGSGEQDAHNWFDDSAPEEEYVYANVSRDDAEYIKVEGDTVTLFCSE